MNSLLREYEAILVGQWITDLANTSAFLFQEIQDLNWVGFYLLGENRVLQLGPFQGRVACTEIQMGQGVCGTAAAERKSILVPDVNQFPGHIACDPRSKSELVIPLLSPYRAGQVIGVLDVDSHLANRFTAADQGFFEDVSRLLLDRHPQ